MMKKLLVLALVLAVTGLANATLLISYDGTSLVAGTKVTVSSDIPLAGGIKEGVAAVQAVDVSAKALTLRTTSAPVATPQYFRYVAADLVGTGYDNAVQLLWGDSNTSEDPATWNQAGMWFSFDLAGYKVGTAENHTLQLDLVNLDAQALGGAGQTLYLIPEPMTMVLLGLGGLFLRKKK